MWSLDWPSYLFCSSIPPPAELACVLSQALGGPKFLFPSTSVASCHHIPDALRQLTGSALRWLVDTLSKHPVLFNDISLMAITLNASTQPTKTWPSFLSLFCLCQGQQPLGKFLTLFQEAAQNLTLPKSAKLAALKVALDLTGADLLPWSKPVGLLQDLIWQLHNYTTSKINPLSEPNLSHSTLKSPNPNNLNEAHSLELSLQNSPAPSPICSENSQVKAARTVTIVSSEKKTTRYELKQIQNLDSPQATANTLCILDSVETRHYAKGMPPVDGEDYDLHALAQKLFSLNSLSNVTIGGHGESPSYFSDDSLFNYQRSPAIPSSLSMRISCDNPVLPRSFSLSTVLGALNLSFASCIEDPLTLFDADPLSQTLPWAYPPPCFLLILSIKSFLGTSCFWLASSSMPLLL
ncbi:hypothetical protein DSO57_1008728 [Entomophthora muscae]|uniref:Uncharacterized protein n=1 Tax=Entomophthora muscae TaxID=34485 RepID=A0ACC2THK5_9FUNG|nr:hypothetical protein DSO57_1008728 [Entomophthora muscae]